MTNISLIRTFDLVEYQVAETYMKQRVNRIASKEASPAIWFLEHKHIYTYGPGYIPTPTQQPRELTSDDTRFHQTDRGGKITYHGPGQRIVYFMLDLKKLPNIQFNVTRFIHAIELTTIETLSEFGIPGTILENLPGVWVEVAKNEFHKIASIGLRFKKSISYYGIGINLATNMEFFNSITPCGLTGIKMTSAKILGQDIEIANFDYIFFRKFLRITGAP